MSEFLFKIDDSVCNHEAVLKQCYKMVSHFTKNPESQIIMDFRDLRFIYPDYALLILCSMKHLENLGVIVEGSLLYDKNAGAVNYLSSMNFFKYLNLVIPSSIEEDIENNYIQIQQYNEDNQLKVLNSILMMLRSKTKGAIDDDVYTSLDYCFNEILDNVLVHSETGNGWVVAQYFKNINTIRLMVCDCGVGIKEALEEAYNFEEDEALRKCIEEGITNGKGQGHGLFATSEFIKMNQGWLSIISGDSKLDVNSDKINVNRTPYWQGTCVYLRINTNMDVDYKKFTGKYYDQKEHVFERMFKQN